MQTPNFSRREVLLWLAANAANIEADSESKCWRAAWESFSRGVLTEHVGPFFEFERVCRWYGYAPHVDSNGVYRLSYYSFEAEFAR
jgi:hypothetical protein